MDTMWKSVTMALRGIRRAPGFSFAVITILALGLGANAVMFEVVDRLLLSPPAHVVDARDVRLLYLRRTYLGSGNVETGRTLTYPDYDDFRHVSGFAEVAAYSEDRAMFGRGQEAREVTVQMASASLFPLLGVRTGARPLLHGRGGRTRRERGGRALLGVLGDAVREGPGRARPGRRRGPGPLHGHRRRPRRVHRAHALPRGPLAPPRARRGDRDRRNAVAQRAELVVAAHRRPPRARRVRGGCAGGGDRRPPRGTPGAHRPGPATRRTPKSWSRRSSPLRAPTPRRSPAWRAGSRRCRRSCSSSPASTWRTSCWRAPHARGARSRCGSRWA